MIKSKYLKKVIFYTILFCIFILISIGYKMIHTENVSINEEFLLYKCKRVIHKNEKVYMTINSIDKDEEGYYILSFDLRYEGDKPIQVTKGAGNFSYLSKFKLIVKSNNIFKRLDYRYFEIADTSEYDYRVHSYRENLPDTLNSGESIRNIKIGLNLSEESNVNISNLKFRIENYPIGSHSLSKSKHKIDKVFKVK